MSEVNCLVRLRTIRFRGVSHTVAGAMAIDDDGQAVVDAPAYAIVFPEASTPVEVQTGQWWRVTGKAKPTKYTSNGYDVFEHRLYASDAKLLRPSGAHIVQLLSRSPDFPRVGEVTAQKLWAAYGDDLYVYLDQEDHRAISTVVGDSLADTIIAGWSKFGASDALKWMQDIGLDLRLSKSVLALWGSKTREVIKEDPYRLLSLGMSWQAADELAMKHFKRAPDDPLRLAAAVESSLFERLSVGDTCQDSATLLADVAQVVGKEHAETALREAIRLGIIVSRHGKVQGLGVHLIETGVAKDLLGKLQMSPLCAPEVVDVLLNEYQHQQRAALDDATFSLNDAQRLAVQACAAHGLLLITGGAGVGKTTVLKAVCHVLDAQEVNPMLMALSGRAAKRMQEATGRQAMTIAGFIKNVGTDQIQERTTIVVDEASMVDVLLACRLVRKLPT
ncbi:MAG: DEAD/DEAH box helicase, partial [Ramlibacter sp.]|nr:DEAD/DEAH box helicase [Ramlibacter sp.]